MLIKSQDESDMYIFGEHSVISIADKENVIFVRMSDISDMVIGEYKERARCFEILEEILIAYAEGAKVFKMPKE